MTLIFLHLSFVELVNTKRLARGRFRVTIMYYERIRGSGINQLKQQPPRDSFEISENMDVRINDEGGERLYYSMYYMWCSERQCGLNP